MAEINATILIPDISGFTEFMSTTELTHGSMAINMLIEAIIDAVGDAYDISEIEGDAVLLIKPDPAPTKQQMIDLSLKIFDAFHLRRKWMQQHKVCPCKACLALDDLTLKFIAHHGPLAEIRVGRFLKHSGPEMIVAHRLLKNSIDSNEYLLITEKLYDKMETGNSEQRQLEWSHSHDEFASVGKIPYRFALLHEARQQTPNPPPLNNNYADDQTAFRQLIVAGHYQDVYMRLMNIPERSRWAKRLLQVEQDFPAVFVGSVHRCTFEKDAIIISPMRMELSGDSIFYAESWTADGNEGPLICEWQFTDTGHGTTRAAYRLLKGDNCSVNDERFHTIAEQLDELGLALATTTHVAS